MSSQRTPEPGCTPNETRKSNEASNARMMKNELARALYCPFSDTVTLVCLKHSTHLRMRSRRQKCTTYRFAATVPLVNIPYSPPTAGRRTRAPGYPRRAICERGHLKTITNNNQNNNNNHNNNDEITQCTNDIF